MYIKDMLYIIKKETMRKKMKKKQIKGIKHFCIEIKALSFLWNILILLLDLMSIGIWCHSLRPWNVMNLRFARLLGFDNWNLLLFLVAL